MTDQMRDALERLLGAADGLIADMRERAIMRGDYEIEDGEKIATLDCGNSVLFDMDNARAIAREALASAQPEGPELTDAEIDELWARHAMSDTFDCVHLLRDAIAADRARRGGVESEPVTRAIHYPTCWDTAAYPTIGDALAAVYHHFKCSECAPPAAPVVPADVIDAVSKALRKAWQLGQTYWQQADHEFASYHRKADETQAKFDALVDETRALLAAYEAKQSGGEG